MPAAAHASKWPHVAARRTRSSPRASPSSRSNQMTLRTLWSDDNLFWEALALSLAMHVFVSFKAGNSRFTISRSMRWRSTSRIWGISECLDLFGGRRHRRSIQNRRPAQRVVQARSESAVVPAPSQHSPFCPLPEETPPPEYNVEPVMRAQAFTHSPTAGISLIYAPFFSAFTLKKRAVRAARGCGS